MFSRSMSSGFPNTLLHTRLSFKARSRLKTSEVKNASSSKPHWLRVEGGFTDRRARRPSSESQHRLYGRRLKSSRLPKPDSSSAKKFLAGRTKQRKTAKTTKTAKHIERNSSFLQPSSFVITVF